MPAHVETFAHVLFKVLVQFVAQVVSNRLRLQLFYNRGQIAPVKIFDFPRVRRVHVVDEFNFPAIIFHEPHVIFLVIEKHLRRRGRTRGRVPVKFAKNTASVILR